MKIVRENINFERGEDPKKGLRIGKYNPQIKKFMQNGEEYEIEVVDDTFHTISEMEVKLKFRNEDIYGDGAEEEFADVYVDGQKDEDFTLFKMTPFKYEFKEQGKYAKPGYTSYGFPIAKDKEDLKRLQEENAYWHAQSGDYSRTDKDPFVAAAKLIYTVY